MGRAVSEDGRRRLDPAFWSSRRVLVTGHMGFKGAWLTKLLGSLGAETIGYGRDHRDELLYRELDLERHTSYEGDIGDLNRFQSTLLDSRADVLFHLAAQPLVIASYDDPVGTFEDNVIGTVKVLEAARHAPDLRAVVVITSDKVYRNNDWAWGYRESDPLGGHDPYSASKAAAEIVTAAMISSFFAGAGTARVATARAGNVIGGGDWAEFRLLPDAARALREHRPLVVRNPASTRPWQHVLDPLAGYAMLAEDLIDNEGLNGTSWNFGPATEDAWPVSRVADRFVGEWGGGERWERDGKAGDPSRKEARLLAVDSTKARADLAWAPVWRVGEAVSRTSSWYRDYSAGAGASALVDRDIVAFLA